MSAFPLRTDMLIVGVYVRYVPKADIQTPTNQRLLRTEVPCVTLVSRADIFAPDLDRQDVGIS